MKNIRRETQGKAKRLGHLVGIRAKTEAALHAIGFGIPHAEHDTPEAHRPVHGFKNDAQDIVELETIDQRVADVLNTGRQHSLRIRC